MFYNIYCWNKSHTGIMVSVYRVSTRTRYEVQELTGLLLGLLASFHTPGPEPHNKNHCHYFKDDNLLGSDISLSTTLLVKNVDFPVLKCHFCLQLQGCY